MKLLKGLAITLLLLILVYLAGPRPAKPTYHTQLPDVPSEAVSLQNYVKEQESKHKIKPNNEARIVWFNDSIKNQTEYAVVYLHGFSASQEEGEPIHRDFAKKFGCNLYLSRLDAHGIDTTAPLGNFTAQGLWNSSLEALAIGKQLGKKVILMSTSTGGTLALKLAAEFPEIAGLILMSPNIEINDPNAWLLNNHWGKQIAHLIVGPYRTIPDTTAIYAQYWNNRYVTDAVVQLEELLETTMKGSVFVKIHQPLLLLYYYKSDAEQDPVVKVSAMKRMFRQVSTDSTFKRAVAIPNAGNHVMGSYVKSQDLVSVRNACNAFAVDILKLKPTDTTQTRQ
jgi:pimeloyl-ACP methyl ester carboxylesterase